MAVQRSLRCHPLTTRIARLVPGLTNQKQIGFAILLVCKSSCELRFAVKGSRPTTSSGAGDYESSGLWQMDCASKECSEGI
jgi:hypothetical protein